MYFSREPNPYTRGGILSKAQRIWSKLQIRGLKVPIWYSGLFGVPDRVLRKSRKDQSSKEQGLALIVRMNYILDYPNRFDWIDSKKAFFFLPARKLRSLVRVLGPIYDWETGHYSWYTGSRMNCSYALRSDYGWKRTLGSTLRNFVHLLDSTSRGYPHKIA